MGEPLTKPDHLRDVPTSRRQWLAQRPAGVLALALAILAFVIVAITQNSVGTMPDWRISVPGFVATAIAALASIARRERAHVMWLAALGIAGAALVFGWFLMVAIVIGGCAILMLIVHTVM